MEFNRIVAITGMPGLFEVVSSRKDGALVRSLEDGSTKFVSSRVHNLSHLESIEIYTVRENVTLTDLFGAMKSSGEALPDVKDNAALKAYFEKVYPDLDFDRVYASDMKKIVKWYETVDKNGIDFTAKREEAEAGVPAEEAVPATEAETAPPVPETVATAPAATAESAAPPTAEMPAPSAGEKPARKKKKVE